jgi:uroporphyrinogen-III decarboxylase
VKKLVKQWKSYGYYHIYFADGYKWPLLDEIISWGLVDAIDPFEPLAQMDVKKFREKYPNITICQPVDCQSLLYSGSPEEVKKATIKAIEDSGKRRVIIGSTSEVHPSVPVKNALAMYETARSYKI